MLNNQQIEELENKYLNKFYHFLKFVEEEMMKGFQTKEVIKDDWFGKYDSKISNFAVGAERIICLSLELIMLMVQKILKVHNFQKNVFYFLAKKVLGCLMRVLRHAKFYMKLRNMVRLDP